MIDVNTQFSMVPINPGRGRYAALRGARIIPKPYLKLLDPVCEVVRLKHSI